MIANNLPALIVVVPLLAGLLAIFMRGRGRAWTWVTLVSWAVLAMCIAQLQQVLALPGAPRAAVSYPMGSWSVPWGIEYRVDALNAFVLVVVAGLAAVVTFASRLSVEKEIPEDRHHFFYAVWMLCITGLLGITVTGDAFNVYVLLEIASLATYTLVAMGKERDRRALTASINYVILGTIGASFILLGIGYLYMVTGTLNMADLAERLRAIYERWGRGDMAYRRTILSAFAFLMVGFSIKLALFPLHSWLPPAYTFAPSPVSALLAATATKVSAYVAIRFIFTILGAGFCFETLPTGVLILSCGSLAVVGGSWLAIRQTNVKRLLAYSSIGQIGYIAVGIGLANPHGLQGSVIHLFNHALMKGGLFLALAAVAYRVGGTDLKHLRGLGRQMPWTMAAFTAGGLAVIGMPLTAGFVSKWYLVWGSFDQGRWLPAAAVIAGSLLALVYVWRVLEVVYFQRPAESRERVPEAPWSIVLPAWILVGSSIYFGIDATLTSRLSAQAVEALLGGTR